MKRFALTGAAGYIAPRHMKAIHDTGNQLIAALDVADSVGIIDSYFPEAEFFLHPERFEAFLERQRLAGQGIDYLTICTPNYMHAPHIRMAFRQDADALCEKPIVLTQREVDELRELEALTGHRVWTVLQLRVHPALLALRERLQAESPTTHDIVLTYVTGRGKWYLKSWKAYEHLSGGLATNIGVHFYDMLYWLFGEVETVEVHLRTPTRTAGFLRLANANVRWFLSIEASDVPAHLQTKGQRTYRSITVDGEEIEFSGGFTDLHTEVYRRTLRGEGFGLDDAATAIGVTEQIRTLPLTTPKAETRHPFLEG
ncbi:MAG: Gfo/Idh/MocA family oxidoreductase [Chloroflexi bacterium]|nr:Gfo/Idh/MocA family oxidoreductase [Chloroflexota bacterium]